MNDGLRSLAVLGIAFAGVLAFMLGLAILILPRPPGLSHTTDATPPGVPASLDAQIAIGAVPAQLGGTLAVSGDRQDTFTVNREANDGRYGLIGDDGRIFFANEPLAVEQMNFDGLSFFPEPDECTITPGERNDAIGVAGAHLNCADMADLRGNATITVAGTIGLPADLLGMRGELPPTGGSVEAGSETLVFTDAVLFTGPRPALVGANPYRMQLVDDETGTVLNFAIDLNTHRLTLANVERHGIDNDVSVDACAIATREVGMLNPRVTLIELSLECSNVDVPELGPVAIIGSLFVEQTEAAH